MTNEVKNIPKLRFPEFNEEWEDNNLKYITTLLKDGTHGTHKDVENGPWLLSAKNIKNNTINISDEDRKISITDYNKIYKNYTLEREDILLSIVGTIGRVSMVKNPVNIAFQRSVAIIRFSKPLESKFFLYLFGTKEFKKKLYRNQVVSAQPGIYLGDLAKFNIIYPLIIEEQQKIGNFFSKLDQQIELEEQKLEKLEEQKKGYMQKIFSQELRFKDENGNDYPNWIFEELNNIFTKYQNTIYLHDNEEYKRISISNKGKITHRDITFGKRIGRKRQYLIDLKKHPNTLTFIRQGVFLGGIGFIPSSLDGYIVTENMPLLSMSEEYSKKFMTYLFSSESYYKSVIFKNLPTGSAQKALHEKDWLKSFVNIPVYSEQEKIGNFFEKQDNLIKKQSDKVELLKERKKGFLQKMFV